MLLGHRAVCIGSRSAVELAAEMHHWGGVAGSDEIDGEGPRDRVGHGEEVVLGTIAQIGGIQHAGLTDVASDGWINTLGVPKPQFGDPAPGTEAALIHGVAAFFDHTLRNQDTPGFQHLAQSDPTIVTSMAPLP